MLSYTAHFVIPELKAHYSCTVLKIKWNLDKSNFKGPRLDKTDMYLSYRGVKIVCYHCGNTVTLYTSFKLKKRKHHSYLQYILIIT